MCIEDWFHHVAFAFQQHANLITQNIVAVGRLRLIRPIGKYIKDNYDHRGGYAPAALRVQQGGKLLKDLPINHQTYLKWMDASIPTEEGSLQSTTE